MDDGCTTDMRHREGLSSVQIDAWDNGGALYVQSEGDVVWWWWVT